jgi:hypothetical protein
MKIELLNKRENFPEIFKASLEQFLLRYANWSGRICWGSGEGLQFRQNEQLNVIYPVSLARRMVDEVTREFRYNPSPARRFAQIIYAGLAIRTPLEIVVSRVMFAVERPPRDMEAWIFIPGNHSIRIIDFGRQSSIVFPKSGFDINMMRRDAAVRQRFPFLLAPRVVEAPSHGGWYIEERVRGLPLNRLSDPAQRIVALNRAVGSLRTLYAETKVSVKLDCYLERLSRELDVLLVLTGSRMAPNFLARLKEIQERASFVAGKAREDTLEIVQSHGDFQPGNILVDGDVIQIIDWEYSKPRSMVYDYLVFTASSRFSGGLESRLADLLDAASKNNELKSWFGIHRGDISGCFAIFLLEELTLKLEESAAGSLKDTSWNLLRWLPEVESFMQRLQGS